MAVDIRRPAAEEMAALGAQLGRGHQHAADVDPGQRQTGSRRARPRLRSVEVDVATLAAWAAFAGSSPGQAAPAGLLPRRSTARNTLISARPCSRGSARRRVERSTRRSLGLASARSMSSASLACTGVRLVKSSTCSTSSRSIPRRRVEEDLHRVGLVYRRSSGASVTSIGGGGRGLGGRRPVDRLGGGRRVRAVVDHPSPCATQYGDNQQGFQAMGKSASRSSSGVVFRRGCRTPR